MNKKSRKSRRDFGVGEGNFSLFSIDKAQKPCYTEISISFQKRMIFLQRKGRKKR
jgi:hypothetical protein